MKWVSILLFLFIGFLFNPCYTYAQQEDEIKVKLSPEQVILNEPTQIIISLKNPYTPDINVPHIEGIQWDPFIARQQKRINNKTSQNIIITFTATKEGKIEIPSLSIALNGKIYHTTKMSFNVKKRNWQFINEDGTIAQLSDVLFLQAMPPTQRKTYYVGETIPIIINVFHRNDITITDVTQLPVFNVNDTIVLQPLGHIGENRHFEFVGQKQVTYKKQNFNVFSFRGYIRPLAPGKIEGIISQTVSIRKPQAKSNDEDILNLVFNRDSRTSLFGVPSIEVPLTTTMPEIMVQSLPPPPQNCYDLGLVGNHEIQFQLSKTQNIIKQGDAITLSLTISNTRAESIQAPNIEIPGFRVYPPTVENVYYQNKRQALLKYVLIPIKSGELNLTATFSIFDPEKQRYKTKKINHLLSIIADISIESELNKPTQPPEIPTIQQPVPVKKQLIDLKIIPSQGTILPLWLNPLPIVFILVLITLLCGISVLWILHIRQKNQLLPKRKRKEKALANKEQLATMLEKADEIQFKNLLHHEVREFFANYFDQPVETSITELAKKCPDSLAKAIENAHQDSFRPNGFQSHFPILQKQIVQFIRHCSLFTLFILPIWVFANSPGTENIHLKDSQFSKIYYFNQNILIYADEKSPEDPYIYYHKGEFQKSLNIFENLINQQKTSAELWFNLGNCHFQLKQFAQAKICYERARRLAPNDAEIIENLNATCRELSLPEQAKIHTPWDLFRYFRDFIRIDYWLLISVLSIFSTILFLFAFLLYKFSKKTLWKIYLSLFMVLILSSLMAIWQSQELYNSNQAIVLSDTALYNLPFEQNSIKISSLHSGGVIQQIENRQNWVKIYDPISQQYGWVKREWIVQIWDNWTALPQIIKSDHSDVSIQSIKEQM